jgi:GGDEF domain-containing protein
MHEQTGAENKTSPQLFKNTDLILRYPVVSKTSQHQFQEYKRQIIKDFHDLFNQQDISMSFGNLFFDPGINRTVQLSDELAKELNTVDPDFYMSYRNPLKILTRRSILRIASSDIINNKNVAFINFDIKDLRLADQVGYGDILLNDFSKVLEIVRGRHHEFNLTPGRVGGDEFCMFLSSSSKIDKVSLQKIYLEVKEELAKYHGYFKTIPENKIEKRRAELKTPGKVEDQIFIANDESSRRIFLNKSIVRGRIPNSDQLRNEKNVSKEEYSLAKSESAKKYYLRINKNPISFRKQIEGFVNKHPEFFKEGAMLQDLVNKNKMHLANYLLDVLKDSLKDPLINDEIYTFPGLIKNLQTKTAKKDERIVHFYMPWLKVLNGDIGYNKTDDVIEKSYNDIISKLEENGYTRDNMIVSRRGGDFIFIIKEYQSGKLDLNCGSSFPEGHIFKKGLPVFLSTVPYPQKGDSISTYILNAEKESKTSFINWLNQEYINNPNKVIKHIDYYLKERTLDRAKDLWEQLGFVNKVSEELKQYILSVINRQIS